jgi:hypothetical protein
MDDLTGNYCPVCATRRFSQLRQGVIRFARWHGIDVPSTEALMADAANELERLRKIEADTNAGAWKFLDTVDELTRLRKIESAARQMSDWLRDNPAAESRISMSVDSGSLVGRILLTDLRKALETETDG